MHPFVTLAFQFQTFLELLLWLTLGSILLGAALLRILRRPLPVRFWRVCGVLVAGGFWLPLLTKWLLAGSPVAVVVGWLALAGVGWLIIDGPHAPGVRRGWKVNDGQG